MKVTTNSWKKYQQKWLKLFLLEKAIQYPKKEVTTRRSEGCFWNIIKSHTHQVGNQEAGKWLWCRGSPIGVRVLSPTPGSPARGSGIGKMSSKSSCLWKQVELELHRNGGNRESTFEGCTQVFRGTGTYSKAATPQEPGTDLPAGLGRSPGGVEVHCGSQLKQED